MSLRITGLPPMQAAFETNQAEQISRSFSAETPDAVTTALGQAAPNPLLTLFKYFPDDVPR